MGSKKPDPSRKSVYSCLFPVYGVQVAKELRGGLRVGKVKIVRAEAIKRSPHTYGVNKVVTKLKRGFEEDFFEQAPTIAQLNWARAFEDKSTAREEKEVRDALLIVAGFSLGFVDRGDIRLTLEPLRQTGFTRHMMFDTKSDAWRTHARAGMPPVPFTLDKQWKSIADEYGFSKFLRLHDGRAPVHEGWRKDLRRAVILAGQSMLAARREEAFLLDMIALETLLTRRDDKFPDALLERLMALLGWTVGDRSDAWRDNVKRVYGLRCSFVHAGAPDDITGADLYTADTLLVNVLMNVSRYSKRFNSKQSIVDYARELDARKTLGLPLRDRRLRLRYASRPLTSHLRKKLEDDTRWRWL